MIPEKPATCKKCGDAISTDIVQALFCDWHPKCFRCTSCGQRLNNWYFQNEGNLYCRRHYWSKFGDRCNACSYITSGPVMAIGEHKYHPECFVCCECQTLIDDDDYALLERSFLYCGQCYRAGPGRSIPPHQEVTAPQTPPHTQTPRRKPHSIHMVEIPPTPERQPQQQQQQYQHHSLQHGQREHSEQHQQHQQEREASPKSRRLQLSLQPVSADVSTAGWRGSVNYRHSFTLEGGRLTPCVQISELEASPELHGLTVGDKILEVNGTAVRDKTLDEIKTLLTNPASTVHVMVERDLSPLRLSPEEDSIAAAAAASSASPARILPSRNASSDDLSSPSVSEGETVVVLDQTVRLRPKGSLRARGHSPTRRRSKSPSPCPSVKQKSIDLSRSHSFSTRQDHRAFRPADLIIGEVLGQGFFGQALKATHRVTGEHMVLKELHNFDEAAQKSFLTEVSMLRNLSHPCVLKFLGAFYRDRKLNLVTEFIDGGTLSDLLLDHTVELSWKQRIGFAKDIASGMSYLHSMNVIHRDLNSQNCLVRKDQTAVVADFGLAKIVQRHDVSQFSTISEKEKEEGLLAGGSSSSTSGRKKKRFSRKKRGTVVGNPYWMAPEMMTKGVYDEKVDVFSFGIIVCETIARVSADPDYLPRSFDFGLNVEAFHSKFCQDGAPEPFLMLAVLCSQIEPDQRPNFDKVHLLCEMLILHVEHGKVIPPELQGSAVEVYHNMKESMYGQNYRDVDSSTQVTNTVTDTEGDSVSPARPGDSVPPAIPEDSSRNEDSEQGVSHIPANEGQVYEACSSSDVEINIQDTTMAPSTLNFIPDNDEKSKINSEILQGTDGYQKLQDTDGYMQHSDQADAVDSQSSFSNTCKYNIRRSSVSGVPQGENGNNEPQELRVLVDDGVGDASVATTNEDYAYFSCSTESPSASFSSPCLSVEDFVSCRGSPASSGSNVSDKVPASDSTSEECGCNGSSEPHTEPSSSSGFQEGTSSQTQSCNTNGKPSPSEAIPKHSRDSGPKLSPSREYQANFPLEYGASLSSPTHSYILKQQTTAGSSECDA